MQSLWRQKSVKQELWIILWHSTTITLIFTQKLNELPEWLESNNDLNEAKILTDGIRTGTYKAKRIKFLMIRIDW